MDVFLSLDITTIWLPTTNVFSKVLADGSNSAILLSFSSSFGRTFLSSTFPNTHCNLQKHRNIEKNEY